MSLPRSVRTLALLLLGFTATSSQIFLLREFVSTFHGNELVIGIYLSVWLLATAAGSGPLAALVQRRRVARPAGSGVDAAAYRSEGDAKSAGFLFRFAVVQVLSAIFLLVAALGIAAPPSLLRPALGEVAGLLSALGCSMLFLFPFCMFEGLLFPLGTRIVDGHEAAGPRASNSMGRGASAVSRVYFLEGVGAAAGGLLVSLVLIHVMSSFRIAAFLASINLLAACALAMFATSGSTSGVAMPARRSLGRSGRPAAWAFAVLASGALILFATDPVTHWVTSLKWRPLEVRGTRQTGYGNLAAVSVDFQYSVYQDGLLLFTTDDVQSSEEVAHVSLLEHPRPEHVLLIGGGVGGVLGEMLKHSSLKVLEYVELDPELISFSKEVLPEHYVSDLDDQRVRVIFTDGRRFLQKSDRQYDVVTMQLPPPYTAQLNRFYTREFFGLVREHLKPDGVFVFTVPEIKEYVSQELASFLGSVSRTAKSQFEKTALVPTSRSLVVCSPRENPYVEVLPESLLSRAAARGVETLFIRDYFLLSTLSRERLAYVESRVRSAVHAQVNTDLRPVGFYYDLILWSAEYERLTAKLLAWVFDNAWTIWVGVAAAGIAVLFTARRRRTRARPLLSSLAVSGFAAIVLELEIVVSFQLLYGSLYDRLGILFTSFMAGLAIGAWLDTRTTRRDAPGSGAPKSGIANGRALAPGTIQRCGFDAAFLRPAAIQFLMGLFAFGFLGIIHLTSQAGTGLVYFVMEWFFPLAAVVAGGLGGALFSSASRAYFNSPAPGGKVGRQSPASGVTYAWDLLGSFGGAILSSVILLPIAGLVATTVIVSALLGTSGVSLLVAGRRTSG
jgi:spermidine synthase